MNLETLATEFEAMPTTQQSTDCASGLAPEITPLALECFKLVGGGESIVLLG